MKNTKFLRSALLLLAGLLLISGALVIRAQDAGSQNLDMAEVKPETLGFSSERLGRLDVAMQAQVDQKHLAGIVTLLARHGKVAEFKVYGKKNIASGAPMMKDTIFRIFSMSKPITGVGMMMLYEEGKWRPSDPISKYIPEFAHLKVFNGMDASGKMMLVDPVHPPTMHELMTHTAGFTYGFFGDTPVDQMYKDQNVLGAQSLQEMIERLARIPLLYQPGSRWVYSVSTDIQGYVIEKLSGQTFPEFLQRRLFGPLGMKDSGFFVPKDKRNRFATFYGPDANGELAADSSPADYVSQPSMPSGGGGMVSTATDYLRLAQMLLNGGELDGVRILAPSTVHLMSSNHLPASIMTGEFRGVSDVTRPGMGWGYDCAVFTDPLQAEDVVGKGTFYWMGAADTWFWIDPTNDLIFVGMTQRMMGKGQPDMTAITHPTVYQALLKPRM